MFAFQNSQSAWLSHYNYNRITDYRMRRSTSRGDRGVGSRGLWCGRENETYTIRHHYGCQGKLFVCMIRGFHQEFGGLGDLTRDLLFWKKTFWLMLTFQLKMPSGSADCQTNQNREGDAVIWLVDYGENPNIGVAQELVCHTTPCFAHVASGLTKFVLICAHLGKWT